MTSIPTTQKALFIESLKGAWVVRDTPVPTPIAGELLVCVEAAGLNPLDWKIHDRGLIVQTYPAIIGLDGAGVVVALGEGVERFKVGDRVLFRPGAWVSRHGTYQQYAVTLAGTASNIPSNILFDEAASIPIAITTAALRLYTPKEANGGIGLTAPWNGGRGKYTGESLLILGASSVVGQAAIQLAAVSGFSPIITTASLHNTDLLKALGATHTLDRTQDEAALTASIRSITGDKTLRYVLDAISVPSTQTLGYRIRADAEGGTLLVVLADAVMDEEKAKGKKVDILNPVSQQHPAFITELNEHIEELLEKGEVKPNQIEYVAGGLASIPDALDRLRKNQVSAAKVVVRPQETI